MYAGATSVFRIVITCAYEMPTNVSLGPEDRLKFRSLCNYPTYTNYTCAEGSRGFAGCLDYIWGTSDIHVDKVLPLPRHELVVKYGAIPSKIAPSDHIPIIAELSFK